MMIMSGTQARMVQPNLSASAKIGSAASFYGPCEFVCYRFAGGVQRIPSIGREAKENEKKSLLLRLCLFAHDGTPTLGGIPPDSPGLRLLLLWQSVALDELSSSR
jgi:hypothetical protein